MLQLEGHTFKNIWAPQIDLNGGKVYKVACERSNYWMMKKKWEETEWIGSKYIMTNCQNLKKQKKKQVIE